MTIHKTTGVGRTEFPVDSIEAAYHFAEATRIEESAWLTVHDHKATEILEFGGCSQKRRAWLHEHDHLKQIAYQATNARTTAWKKYRELA